MPASLAKLGASVGLAIGLTIAPFLERLQEQRPLMLYAMVYVQAVLGNTESAVKIAQEAASAQPDATVCPPGTTLMSQAPGQRQISHF